MATPPGKGDLINLIDNFQQDSEIPFTIQPVSYLDVLREIKSLRFTAHADPTTFPVKLSSSSLMKLRPLSRTSSIRASHATTFRSLGKWHV